MAVSVKFIDNSINVKAALSDVTTAWLYTWSSEIASQARRNCQMDGDNSLMGYPKSLLGFLTPYMKARF